MNNPLISHLLETLIQLDKSWRIIDFFSSKDDIELRNIRFDINDVCSMISDYIDKNK